MFLTDIAEGYTLEDIKKNTGCGFELADKIETFWTK